MGKKRIILGIAALMTLGVGIVGLTALPAQAWLPTDVQVSGKAECQTNADGAFWHITWTVTNNETKDGTVLASSPPGVVPLAMVIPAGSSATFDQTLVGSTTGDQSLTVTLEFGEFSQEKITATGTVALKGACTTPTPTPSPTKSPHKTPSPSVAGNTGGTAFTGGNFTGAFVAILAFVLLGLGVVLVARQRAGEDALDSPRDLY